jgi:hypothetical protein
VNGFVGVQLQQRRDLVSISDFFGVFGGVRGAFAPCSGVYHLYQLYHLYLSHKMIQPRFSGQDTYREHNFQLNKKAAILL